MYEKSATNDHPGLTDIHAHPAMNAFLWDRDLRRHYFTAGGKYCPLASLTDFKLEVRRDLADAPRSRFVRCVREPRSIRHRMEIRRGACICQYAAV